VSGTWDYPVSEIHVTTLGEEDFMPQSFGIASHSPSRPEQPNFVLWLVGVGITSLLLAGLLRRGANRRRFAHNRGTVGT